MEAKIAIRRFKPRIVGVTGSVGKSSTKEAIAAVLGSRFNVRKSMKSYNSELGLSLAVLDLETAWHSPLGWMKNLWAGLKVFWGKKFPEVLVLEMGVDRPNDLDRLLKVAKPNIGVVTMLGFIPVHVEFFPGPEDVVREKSKIIKAVPASGKAILNRDDEICWDMRELTGAAVISYGFSENADISASNYKISDDGISFKVSMDGANVPVRLHGAYGKQHVYAALAAIAVGSAFDMNLIEMSEALSLYKSPPGRLKMIEGLKGTRILDDSYNASPLAVTAALDVLESLQAKRKIVVLGDMLELGKHTVPQHKAVGQEIAKVADHLITVGPRTKFTAEEALAHGMTEKKIASFSTSREAAKYLEDLIKEGDLILVKGSQSMRMERVSEALMAHPEEAFGLLARQDDFWKKKE